MQRSSSTDSSAGPSVQATSSVATGIQGTFTNIMKLQRHSSAQMIQKRLTHPNVVVAKASTTTSTTTIPSSSSSYISRDSAYMISSLAAGVGSGAVSGIVCAPLDLVRTRMQVWGDVMGASQRNSVQAVMNMMKDIVREDGVTGCFRGLGATLVTVPFFWGVYFPLYDDLKRSFSQKYPTAEPAFIHMGSAVCAGVVSDLICNPLFVIRTRLQTEAVHNLVAENGVKTQQSMWQTAKSLYYEGGAPIFWRGMTANLLGLSHVAIQFPTYEKLKIFFRGTKQEESAVDLLAASALSKMFASVITYPHEVIRSRMMDSRSKQSIGFITTCKRIYQTEQIYGFYAGLPISMVRVIPNTCMTFLTYELFLRWARKHMLNESQ